MSSHEITKRYKFKIDQIHIAVDLDDSFSEDSAPGADFVSSIGSHHYHAAYEMFFIKESPVTLFAGGATQEYASCALCIPPQLGHMSFRKSGYRFLFTFEPTDHPNSDFAQFLCTAFAASHPIRLAINEQIMGYARDLVALLRSNSKLVDEIAISFLKLIFYKLYELNAVKKSEDALSTKESYLLKIDAMLNLFQNDINLKTVADALHLSTKQTSRIIIKHYKKPLSVLITEKRLNVACLLLQYTENTIADIVEYIHFPSESYFYAQFKKTFGCTPHQFQKQSAKKMQTDESFCANR